MTLFSCDLFNLNWGGNKYTIGHFPTSPVNLEEFNTEFDDYNSDIPVFWMFFLFIFLRTETAMEKISISFTN
jgi:hypothetical protein